MHCFFLRAQILDHKLLGQYMALLLPCVLPQPEKTKSTGSMRSAAACCRANGHCRDKIFLCRPWANRPLHFNFLHLLRCVSLCTAACALTKQRHSIENFHCHHLGLEKWSYLRELRMNCTPVTPLKATLSSVKPSRIISWLGKAKSMRVDRQLLAREQPHRQMGSNLLSQHNLIVCLKLDCMSKSVDVKI